MEEVILLIQVLMLKFFFLNRLVKVGMIDGQYQNGKVQKWVTLN